MLRIARFLERMAREPFRIFFPLGFLASVVGVSLWPALFQGWIDYYPLQAHARWMVIGFGGSLIVGFIGTAGPRMLGTRLLFPYECLAHLTLAMAMMTTLWFNRIQAADLLTGLWLSGVLASLLLRFVGKRTDTPPPGFLLVLFGLGGAIGSSLVLASGRTLDPAWHHFFRLLYFQGFLWLPILGIAPYLLPRFFGNRSPHAFPDSRSVPVGWRRPFLESTVAGLVFLASLAVEAWVHARSGQVLRAGVVTVHLLRWTPGLADWSRGNGLKVALRLVLPCAVGGWLLAAIYPHLRIGMLHLMFIGGPGLLMLATATRVILSHGGRQDLLAGPMKWWHLLAGLVLLTAATRLTADFVPKIRVSHFLYAAVLWVLLLVFWVWKIRRALKAPQLPPKPTPPSRTRRSTAALPDPLPAYSGRTVPN